MIDFTSVLKTTQNCLLDYTYATFNVNRSGSLKKNFNYKIFCRVTYVTGCYSLTLPLSEGEHVAKSLQDIGLQEKYGLQNSPWGGGGKPYPASGLGL